MTSAPPPTLTEAAEPPRTAASTASEDQVELSTTPRFVAHLLSGVFQANVDTSIQQMEAYGDLVKDVSKSVDAFAQDEVSSSDARYVEKGEHRAVLIDDDDD